MIIIETVKLIRENEKSTT